MALALALKDILEALDALSEQERAMVRRYLEERSESPSSELLSELLAIWDDSISLPDADELNRLIRDSRHNKTESTLG